MVGLHCFRWCMSILVWLSSWFNCLPWTDWSLFYRMLILSCTWLRASTLFGAYLRRFLLIFVLFACVVYFAVWTCCVYVQDPGHVFTCVASLVAKGVFILYMCSDYNYVEALLHDKYCRNPFQQMLRVDKYKISALCHWDISPWAK